MVITVILRRGEIRRKQRRQHKEEEEETKKEIVVRPPAPSEPCVQKTAERICIWVISWLEKLIDARCCPPTASLGSWFFGCRWYRPFVCHQHLPGRTGWSSKTVRHVLQIARLLLWLERRQFSFVAHALSYEWRAFTSRCQPVYYYILHWRWVLFHLSAFKLIYIRLGSR